jgi:hypothetical protein
MGPGGLEFMHQPAKASFKNREPGYQELHHQDEPVFELSATWFFYFRALSLLLLPPLLLLKLLLKVDRLRAEYEAMRIWNFLARVTCANQTI